MSGETIVTTLVVDARGVEVGTAAHIKAMKAAQAAVDRYLDSHNKAAAAAEKGATQTVRESETISRSAAAWDRLRSKIDDVTAAQIKGQREIERATITADNAVKRGITTREEANAAIAATVKQMGELVKATQAAAQADAAAPLKRAFDAVSEAARRAVRESLDAWSTLATGVTRAAQQMEREGNAAWATLGRGVTEAARTAVQQSNAMWATLGRGVTEAARAATQQSNAIWGNLARGIADAAKAADSQSQAAWQNIARGVTDAAKASERLRAEFNNLQGQLDPAIQRQQQLANAQRVVNAAVAGGITTQAEGARMLRSYGDSARLTHYQLSNLSFQFNDVIQGFAIGQRPMSILTQQGFQIVQAMGGVGNALRVLISPLGLAVAGFALLAATIATVIARASSLEAASRQIAGLSAAMGGAVGLTTGQIQDTTRQVAALPGFSRTDTQSAANGLLGNRFISGDSFARTLQIGRDLALLTGQELPDAVKELASALTGGEAGLKRLDQQYNIFTVDQLKLIEQLERQGRVQDQVKIGLDAMSDRFAGRGTAALSDMRRAADQALKGFDDLVTGIAASPQGQAALAYLKLQAELLERVGKAANPGPPKTQRQRDEQALRDIEERGTPGFENEAATLRLRLSYVGPEGAAGDVEKRYAAFAKMIEAEKEAEKRTQALIEKFTPLDKAARDLTSEMEALAMALARATDPDKASQLEAALRAAGRAAYDISSSSFNQNNPQTQAAVDAQEVAAADRRERALVEARQQAVAAYQALTPAQQAATDFETFVKKRLDVVRSQIGGAVRDLMEDIDAAARHSLEIAKAYGKGLKEGFLAEAKAAIDEMIRTTPGLEGQEATLLRQRLQQEASQAIAALGGQSARQLPNVEAQERMADAESRGAAAIREAAIATQVYVGTYEARVRAELANNPIITAEYEKQRAILEDLIRRQSEAQRRVEAIQLNRQYDPRANYDNEISKLKDLAATGLVSARAFEEAWRESYIKMGTASESWVDGATAGLLEYARQAERIGGAVADILVRTFSTIEDTIARLLLGMKVNVGSVLREIAADIAKIFIRQNLTGPIANFFGSLFSGGGSTVSAGGVLGGISQQFMGGGGTGGPGSSGNGVGGSSFNPLGLFGGGSSGGFGGSIGRFFNTPISSLFGGGIDPTSAGSFLGGTTLGQGLGLIGGIGSGIFQLASGNPIGGISSLIGAGVSLIPGIGQIAGPVISILGSVLGGLFKSKPDIKAQGWHDYDVTTGRYTGGQTFAQGVAAPIAPGVGNDALKLIKAFGGKAITSPEYYIWAGKEKTVYDATVTAEGSPTYARLLQEAFANGAQGIDQAQWAARKALWTDAGNVDLPISGLTEDSGKLMQQLALMILKAGVRDNDYTGLTNTSKSIIRNFPDADTQGLAQALQWGKETYDILVRTDTITNAEKSITSLKDSFQAAILKAEEYSLATDKLVEAQSRAINKVATDFGQNVTDQILGLTDPAALQKLQVERAREEALKEWDYLNQLYLDGTISTLIDRNKINELYDLQLNQITSQSLTDLQDLWKRLTYGDLSNASPVVTLAGAQGTYDDVIARARAGSASALSQLPGAASDLINAQRAYTGNNAAFEQQRLSILSDIAPWVAANQNAAAMTVGFAPATEAAMGDLIVKLSQMTAALAEQSQRIADLERQLSRQMAA